MLKAINIQWDTEEEEINLPKEINIPKEFEEDEEKISNYLSDLTGFCHFGFELIRK